MTAWKKREKERSHIASYQSVKNGGDPSNVYVCVHMCGEGEDEIVGWKTGIDSRRIKVKKVDDFSEVKKMQRQVQL